MSFDWQQFFKTQVEECRELEKQAVDADDRAFWRQAVSRWEEAALRQAQEAQRQATASSARGRLG